MADEDFFAKPTPQPILPRDPGGYEPPPVPQKPAFLDTLAASFEMENEIGSLISMAQRQRGFEPVPGYNPFEDDNYRGSRYLQEHASAFIGVRSPSEAYSVKQQIDREEENQRLLAASGWTGTLTSLAAGLASPTNFIPGGQVVNAARRGERIARSAGSVALGSAAGAAIQEGALHATQVTRTAEESGVSVVGAALLGSAVGTAAGMFAPKTVTRLAGEMAGELPPRQHFALAGGGRGDVGAAVADTADTTLKQGWGGATLSRIFSFMTPLQRLQNAEAEASRLANLKIADPGGARMNAHTAEGGHTAIVPGGSVEIRAKVAAEGAMANFQKAFNDIYQEYWQATKGTSGVAGKVEQAVNAARKALGQGADDAPMSPSEFSRAVGIAMRTDGAQNADPFVQRMAQVARQHFADIHKIGETAGVVEPITKASKFAADYVPRIYLKQAIGAKAQEFTDLVFRSMKRDQEQKAILQGDATRAMSELKATGKAEKKLLNRRDTISRATDDVDSRIAEVTRFDNRAQSRREAAMARVFDMNTEITDLEAALADAKATQSTSRQELARREKELNVLRRARDKALAAAEKEPDAPATEIPLPKDTFPKSINAKRVVDYTTGERNEPRVPKTLGFLQWVIDQGGVRDTGGDIANALGGAKPPKGLIREDGHGLDELAKRYGEKIGQETYLEGQVGTRFEDEIGGWIDDAIQGGRNPPGWEETYPAQLRSRIQEYELGQGIRQQMEEAGLNPDNRKEVIAFLRGDDPASLPGRPAGEPRMSDEEWEGLLNDPIENFRTADERMAAEKAGFKEIGKDIDRLKKKIQAREKTEARNMGARDEADVNATAARSRLDILLDRAERIAEKDRAVAKELEDLSKRKDATRAELERIVTEWKGDTSKAAQSALARRAEEEAKRQERILNGEYKGRNERLTMADADVETAAKRIVRSERNKTDAELMTQARETQSNFVSTPDGRLPYEWGETATNESRAALAARGKGEPNIKAAKERRVPIEDKDMLDFLENDIRTLAHSYAHSIIPQAEMARMFGGDVSGAPAIRAIKEEYAAKIAALSTKGPDGKELTPRQIEKESARLTQAMNADIRDFAAMRDRILGTYAVPSDPDSVFYRGASLARQFNFLSKMGMMVPSSIADTMMPVMRHGLGATAEAWAAGMNRLSKDPNLQKMNKLQRQILTDAGVAVDMIVGQKALSFAEVFNDYGRKSKFERGMAAAVDAYSYTNLSKQWDTAMNSVAGVAALSRIMRGVEEWATKGRTADAEFLAAHNIGQDQARRIWAAAAAGDGERIEKTGVFMPEGRSWKDQEAYEMLRVALRQVVDSTQLKPGTGMDKPLWMSTPTGAVIGQFRSFIISSQQRIIIAGLQQADAAMAQGMIGAVAMGGLSVALTDLAKDGALKERAPGEWFTEAFDRSGLGGVSMELNNMAEKLSNQTFGLRPLSGQEEASRYASRSKADVVLGPSLGFVGDMTRIPGAILRRDVERGDIKAVVNQLPGRNHFLVRRGFNALKVGIEGMFGIEPLPTDKH